jgi:hypothetical protein
VKRYQELVQKLNNIPKVCTLHNMTMDSLEPVLAGGGADREAEAKNAFALCPATDVRLTVADLPNNQLSDRRGEWKSWIPDPTIR